MTEPPAEVLALAERRRQAREEHDFATADALRGEIEASGWLVKDTPAGAQLLPKPPYSIATELDQLPDRSREPDNRRCSVALLVDGWPDELRTCVASLLTYAPEDVVVLALDIGNADGVGDVLHELAQQHPGRLEELHLSSRVGWGEARTALLRADSAAFHIWLETSTVLTGDAVTPLLQPFDDSNVVGTGWRGVNAAPDWLSFDDAGPGPVDALLGYAIAMRRDAALEVGGPHPKARFYRNADIEFSFLLRESRGGRLVVPSEELPLRQTRHRGYHDTDPAYRDKESKRNYDRFLQRYRGREDLRSS